jgi:predicted Fe-S protein YdhL (DUF1289 family)
MGEKIVCRGCARLFTESFEDITIRDPHEESVRAPCQEHLQVVSLGN